MSSSCSGEQPPKPTLKICQRLSFLCIQKYKVFSIEILHDPRIHHYVHSDFLSDFSFLICKYRFKFSTKTSSMELELQREFPVLGQRIKDVESYQVNIKMSHYKS
jgi:hypothetical protein